MKNTHRALRMLFAAALLLSLPLVNAQQRQALVTQPVNDTVRIPLTGNVNPIAQARFDRGAVSDSNPTGTLFLVLGRSTGDQNALDSTVAALNNPSSPQYRHWLTPTEYANRFGATPADISVISSWLQSEGLQIEQVSPARNFIRFSGTMGELRAAFGTAIHQYQVNGVTHLASPMNPQIPAALAPVVRGVTALNDVYPKAEFVRSPLKAQSNPKANRVQPDYTFYGPRPWGPNDYDIYYLPVAGDAAIMYDTPNSAMNTAYSGTTWDGTGVSIGVVGDSDLPPRDLQDVINYRTMFLNETAQQAAPYLPTVVVDGTNPGLNDDALEAVLDLEMAQALAPGAKTTFYTAANTTLQYGVFLAMERAVNDNAVSILNISFGECEQQLGAGANAFLNELYEQAAAQGITVVVASGDSGSADCDGGSISMLQTGSAAGLGVNGLASTPWNVAVGATDFDVMFGNPSQYVQVPSSSNSSLSTTNPYHSTALGYIPEEPWNDSTTAFGQYQSNTPYYWGNGPTNTYASGGGMSSQAVCSGTISATTGACSGALTGYAKPAFQASATPGDGVRDLPDISFFGAAFMGDSGYSQDFNNAWAICADSDINNGAVNSSFFQQDCTGTFPQIGVTPVGGTSSATPLFAGVLAMVSQSQGGNRLGQADTVLYNLYAHYPAVFHDVTQGNNSVLCAAGSANCGSNLFINGYNAGTGYDLASGLGSIDVAQLVQNWGNATFNPTSTNLEVGTTQNSLSTAPLTIPHGTPVFVQTGVSPTAVSGNVALVGNSSQENSDAIAVVPLQNGSASFTTMGLPGGSYTLVASYGGDATDAASQSQGIPVLVTSEASKVNVGITAFDPTTLKPAPATSVPYGQYLYVDVTPYGSTNGLGKSNPATGSVTLTQAGTSVPTSTIGTESIPSEGTAEFQLDPIATAPGSYTLTAQYGGDDSYSAGAATSALAVTKAPITLNFYPGCDQISAGKSVCMPSSHLATDSIGGPPTGTMVFTLNGKTILTLPVAGTAAYGSYTASGDAGADVSNEPDVSSLAGTAITLTATYSGDSNYQPATATATYIVPEPASAAITMSNSGAVTVTRGQQGTSTITVTPVNGFLGPVSLACKVSAGTAGGNLPGCTVAPSVSISGTTAQTVTLTINTVAPTTARNTPPLLGKGSFIALAGVLLCGIFARRKAWRGMLMIAILGVLALGLPVIGCSGGNNIGGGGSGGGTTTGTYTVTVTGANGSIQASTPVTLTVQ